MLFVCFCFFVFLGGGGGGGGGSECPVSGILPANKRNMSYMVYTHEQEVLMILYRFELTNEVNVN